MGGHHHSDLPKIPDWRIYRVQDVPQLVRLQKTLASLGLHDPWLRNEVWKYTEDTNKYSKWYKVKAIMSPGFKYGLIAAVITAAIEEAFFPLRKAPSSVGHGHH